MRYLLDTNICIALMKRASEQLKHEVVAHAADRIEISVVTVAELAWGALRSSRRLLAERRLEFMVDRFKPQPFDESAARAFAEAGEALRQRGLQIGTMDLLIAAQALSLGATVVTNNVREFSRVAGLKFVDWTSSG